jgi:predicted AlkP superfamily pyrophosphatase or phosphodiesterase
MNKYIILLAALMGQSLWSVAQKRLPGDRPKLIVQVVVGQMRNDYLLRFKNNLADNGFKLLMTEGAFCQNATFGYLLTQTAPGLATIATGSHPAQHGVPSDSWYDRSQNAMVDACADPRETPIDSHNDRLKKSPRCLAASTVGDELRMLNRASKVLGVAFNPEEAMLLSGHNSTAAYWFDELSGKFVSGAYYMPQLPQWVQSFNDKKLTDTYASRGWTTLLPIERYEAYASDSVLRKKVGAVVGSPYALIAEPVKKASTLRYDKIGELPYGDNLVKDFAISAVVGESLGKGSATDMLTIYFGSLRSIGNRYGTLSPELEDAFYRADENLKHLLAFLSSQVGKENLLLVLASDHGACLSQEQLEAAQMPHGSFDHNKAQVLLRSYLNIVYGKGEWVQAFSQKQIFLNHTLVEDSNLRLADVLERAAEFMLQFAGVAHVATATTLAGTAFSDGVMRKMQNGFYPKRSGDIILNLAPGWYDTSSASASNSAYSYDTHVPLMFYGWRVKRRTIAAPVDMADIAPTLATLVGIPLPNAACGRAIGEVVE